MPRKEIIVNRGGGSLGSHILYMKDGDTVAWKVVPPITSTQTLSVVSSDPAIPSTSIKGSSTLDVTPVYTSSTTVTYTLSVDAAPEGNGSLVIDTIGTGGGVGPCKGDDEEKERCEVVHEHHHGSKA